jgi:hypothetical protein
MLVTAAPEVTESELVIGGMTCAAWVQAKLNKVGVTATVKLSTEQARVAPVHVSASDPVGAVEAADYSPAWAFCCNVLAIHLAAGDFGIRPCSLPLRRCVHCESVHDCRIYE